MDTEQLPVESIIVQHLPSPRLTGGKEATVGCFKHDINIQIDAWATVVFVVLFFVGFFCIMHAVHCFLPTLTVDLLVI